MLIALAIVIVASCSKSVNEQKPAKLDKHKLSLNSNIAPDIYNAITSDEAFLQLVNIDNQINEFSPVLHAPIHEIDIAGFGAAYAENDSKEEVAAAMEEMGVQNAIDLLYLFDDKKAAIQALVENHESIFYNTDPETAATIFKDVYAEYLNVRYSSPNPCAAGYVLSSKICDKNFALEVAGVYVLGAIGGVIGTPALGAFTVSGGVGLAWMQHASCMVDAADNYKLCRQLKQRWEEPYDMEDGWSLIRIPWSVLMTEGVFIIEE